MGRTLRRIVGRGRGRRRRATAPCAATGLARRRRSRSAARAAPDPKCRTAGRGPAIVEQANAGSERSRGNHFGGLLDVVHCTHDIRGGALMPG